LSAKARTSRFTQAPKDRYPVAGLGALFIVGSPSDTDPTRPSKPAWLRWLARGLLAAGGPLLAFFGLEVGLRIIGFGRPSALFIPDSKPGFYRTNPDFGRTYFPASFDIAPLPFRIAARKQPGHVRIFVLGESAVRGTPEPGFGFAAQLRAQLRAAYPKKEFEVYNLGVVAINSHAVYQMARQALALEPDLFVVYMGNNEVVGPFGPGSTDAPLPLIRASIWATGMRTGQLLGKLFARPSRSAGGASDWRGMDTFSGSALRADDGRLEAVYRHFEANLSDLTRLAARKGVPTIVVTVVANLKDCPPFQSLHRPGLEGVDLERWKAAEESGRKLWEAGLGEGALVALRSALSLDPEFAETHYILGKILEEKGDLTGARTEYLEALHWDALRFRPDAPINAAARRVAARSGGSVVLVDAARDLGADADSTAPPSGRELLLEHVHFNWPGNVRMGRMLAEACASVLFGAGRPDRACLDADGAAAALGFTDYGQLRMLRLMDAIVAKPPFTNQLDFGESRVRQQADIRKATERATSVEGFFAERTTLLAAEARDAANPGLPLQLAELDSESGQLDEALQSIDRVMELEPLTSERLARRGQALSALQRDTEAQSAVLAAIQLDPYNLPAYTALVDVVRKTAEFDKARNILKAALLRSPESSFLRLTYADLLFFHGDHNGAIGECTLVLGRDAENQDALRRLVSFYQTQKRSEDAFALMKTARRTQPLNYENNIELARIYNDRTDDDNVTDCLEAAAQCGPADAPIHLYLANRYKKAGRPLDSLVELCRARRVASDMGDKGLAERIAASIRAGDESATAGPMSPK
jgi:tetratricopeptide (TPR) repeat protein